EHHRLRDFLTRVAQPHEWLEAGSPEAERVLSGLGLVDPPLPVVVDSGDVYTGATVESLAEAWHHLDPPKRSLTTSRSLEPARRASAQRSTQPLTASRRSSSSATSRAARRRTRP